MKNFARQRRFLTVLPKLSWTSARQPVLLLLAAVLQGLLYLALLPPWQHYDEPTHFEYAWLIANRGRLPQANDVDLGMRRAVATSMWEHGFWGNVPKPNLETTNGHDIAIGINELLHPPGYYLLVSLPLYFARPYAIDTQLYAARSVSLILFVLTVLVVWAIVRDLSPPGHVLRWGVPLAAILLPPFADLMTSVNNDVGAVAVFTLFLWGGVRAIRHGLTLGRLLWLVGAALLAALMKSTAALALALAPPGILIALWAQRRWRWGPLLLGFMGLAALGLVAVFAWGDAAMWYRWYGLDQPAATRATHPSAPLGQHVVVLRSGTRQNHLLLNPILDRELPRLVGQTVTVGGWIWADRPAKGWAPGLAWSEWGTRRVERQLNAIELTQTPRFVVQTFQVPARAAKLYYALLAGNAAPGEPPFQIYLDGAVIVPGSFAPGVEPRFTDETGRAGSWSGQPFVNLLRNGSAEQAWPRLRTWPERFLGNYTRSERVQSLAPLWDVERTGPLLVDVATVHLVGSFFARFAWGHISLLEVVPLVLLQALVLATCVGAGLWWLRARPAAFVRPALAFLLLAGLAIWANALVWPLAYTFWANVPMPSARYGTPVIAVSALVLAGGWWALWPGRYRGYAVWAFVAALLVLNGLAIQTIWTFYRGLLPS